MKTIFYTDETAKKIVEKFCGQVFWLRQVHHIYQELFENEESIALMERTARSFFHDLNKILLCYVLLEFSKITDPAESRGKENFSVENLVERIDWPEDIREKLSLLNEKTESFGGYIREARNKLFAHTDMETVLTGRKIGEFPEGEDEVFLNTLHEICNITHEACFGSIVGDMFLAHEGDVIDLKRALENAVVFEELLSESPEQEQMKLYLYVEKVRRSLTSM